MLRRAACIHVFTEKEMKDVRAMGLSNPVAILPNGVNLNEFRTRKGTPQKNRAGGRIMLYLGRLHPKKGLPMLLKAWQKTMSHSDKHQPWCLAIAGWDQNGHEEELKVLCDELGLSRNDETAERFVAGLPNRETFPDVIFLGPAFGELKSNLYSQADAFVLPSLSEGLPMTVLEAWATSLPVLMTHDCNLPEGREAGAAIVCSATEEAIACSLNQFRDVSLGALAVMGENGRRLVECSFQWSGIAAKLSDVYRWVLGRGPQPDCVQLH